MTAGGTARHVCGGGSTDKLSPTGKLGNKNSCFLVVKPRPGAHMWSADLFHLAPQFFTIIRVPG